MNTSIVRLERSEDLLLRLPEGWANEGEKVFIREENGSILISKGVEVELDLDDATFSGIAKLAHERDITFNEMVIKILEEMLDTHENTPQ